MRPVTPSSNHQASYRPLPFLRAVFQSIVRAIFTHAELGERLHRSLPNQRRRIRQPPPRHLIRVARRQGTVAADFVGREYLEGP